MITPESTPEQGLRIAEMGAAVLDYLAEHSGPVPSHTLLDELSQRRGVSLGLVATAISRVGDRLVWDYSHGPARLSLRHERRGVVVRVDGRITTDQRSWTLIVIQDVAGDETTVPIVPGREELITGVAEGDWIQVSGALQPPTGQDPRPEITPDRIIPLTGQGDGS